MNNCLSIIPLLFFAIPSVVCIAGVWLMAKEHRERARTHTRRREDRRIA